MVSTPPFDSCPSLSENPSFSNNAFLDNLFISFLDDEEILFDQLLHHHQSPYGSMNITNSNTQNPNSTSMDSNKDPGGNYSQNDLCHVTTTTTEKIAPTRKGGAKRKQAGTTARRRTGKKDRHSKIHTAQGPRDRRMRLSLQIARKFFDLQDMLGFDKASKTIEWLFSKSKSAIRDLTSTLPPHKLKGNSVINSNNSNNNNNLVSLEDLGGVNKASHSSPFARESREKARARARQRTLEKNKQKELMSHTNPNNNSTTTTTTTTADAVDQDNHKSNPVSIIEKLLGTDSSASSSSIYDDCSFLGYGGNWAMDNLSMYPSNYGAITGVDELQVILQQQNPKSESLAGLSGTHYQSPYPDNHLSSRS